MLKECEQLNLDFSEHHALYDILIEKDNLWRQLNERVDFSFVVDLLRDKYSSTMGRTAVDVVRMFKYLLLKNYYHISDVGLVERTRTDLLFKYFLGYSPEETKLISPSLLTVFRRERLVEFVEDENGNKVPKDDKTEGLMDALINKTIELALESGVINAKNMLIADSTHSNSLYSHISPREMLIRQTKTLRKLVYDIDETMKNIMPKKRESSGLLEDQIDYTKELLDLVKKDEKFTHVPVIKEQIDYLEEIISDTETEIEYSRDNEAKVGHKTSDTSFFGYKTHIAMTPERIITAAVVTTGEKHDGKQLKKLIEKSRKAGIKVEAVIGDGAYSEEDNLEYCREGHIKNVSKLSGTVLHGNRRKKDEFEYNKDAKMYVCKAGHMAIKKTHQKGNKHNNYSEVDNYHFDVEKCKHCPLKEGCYKDGAKTKTYSVTIKKEIHTEQMKYMESEEFRELYKNRYKIEAKNGELKTAHDYAQSNACGISGMTIQGATTLFLVNMKRIIKLEKQKRQKIMNDKQ